jgi:ribosomal-protein-alanine N-acetyltransferase
MDLTKMEIHTMHISDLNEIKKNLITDFDNFWNYEIFKEELANNNSSYLVLRYNNEIVCYGGIKFILDEADIMNIVTRKDKRNMGFAKFILNELITIAKEENCKQITLEVNENNKPAIHLYEVFNFKQVGLRKKYYNGTDNAIIMTLEF